MEGSAASRNLPLKRDGKALTTDADKAELLAEHYHKTVGFSPDIQYTPEPVEEESINLRLFSAPFTTHEIETAIKDAKKGKSPGGPDAL